MINKIKNRKILPILRGLTEDEAFFLVDCFQEVGLDVLEISLNQPDSYHLLESLIKKFGKEVSIGAGTVLTPKMAYDAKECGASFFLSPSTSKEVFETAKKLETPYIPGALTPTEIQYASEMGASLIKVFPVRQLGPTYIKDVLASLNHVDLLAVGGVDLKNVKQLLQAGVKGVGIGSSLFDQEQLNQRNKKQIMQKLSEYKQQIQ